MRFFPTNVSDLTEDDILRDGRKVASVSDANEWTDVQPIGFEDRVTVVFSDGSDETFDADAEFEVQQYA